MTSEPLAAEAAAGPPGPTRERSERVLVHAPTGRDAELTCQILDSQGLDCHLCPSCEYLVGEIDDGAGLAVLAAECFDEPTVDLLVGMLDGQPVWSDLPILVLTRESDDSTRIVRALGPSANLTLLERPVWLANLVSAVQAAIRARRRQYDVRDLVERLAESDRMKDEFLAMLGHELRNPLNAIATSAAILGETGNRRASVERQTQMIGRQTRHLSRMVDDLLDFSRLSLGKIELRKERVDLCDPARDAVDTLEMAGFRGRQHLEVRLSQDPVLVVGDPLRLEQVIANLLQNAVKYTPEGGRVRLTVEEDGDEAVLTVRDDGVGIAPDAMATIFAPFIQLGDGRGGPESRGLPGGLGIGLYLARRLAHLHGGRLEAQSEGEGRGSEFAFRLPLAGPAEAGDADRPEATDGSRSAPGERPGHRPKQDLRVLLVEDNPEGREALEELLKIWGCTVVTATNGSDGVARALAERPRLALIDIGLPDITGYEVAERLREEMGPGDCRLVAITGYGQPDDRRRALEAGFDRHIVKPVDPDELSGLLDSV